MDEYKGASGCQKDGYRLDKHSRDQYNSACECRRRDQWHDNHTREQYQYTREQIISIMERLIRVYDAADSLYHFSHHLTGNTLSPHSIVSELLLVTDVINHMSALYDPGVDWEESRVRIEKQKKGRSHVQVYRY